MNIPDPENVASVEVDGVMWSTAPRDGVPGWIDPQGEWISTTSFPAYLDTASSVTFYSPIARVIT